MIPADTMRAKLSFAQSAILALSENFLSKSTDEPVSACIVRARMTMASCRVMVAVGWA